MSTYDRIEDATTATAAPGNNMSNWTVDDIRKSDILVFRESASEYVDTVVAPNGLQIGLLDEAFLTDLLVTGHITGSGVIYAEQGFSGSLQTLVDGSNYLRAGSNVTITNNTDGSITIASTGGGGGGGGGSRVKFESTIPGTINANTTHTVAGIKFADYSYDPNIIDIFLNGDLLLSGSQAQVLAGTHDYYLLDDVSNQGQIRFRYSVSASDELVVIAGSSGGGGGGGGGTTYSAGDGMSLTGTVFNVDTDNATINKNGSDQLQVLKVPNAMTTGNGLTGGPFDGSAARTITVQPVAGSPITVSGAGVGMSFSPVNALSLAATDEILISKGGTIGKSTVQDVLNLFSGGSGAPTNEPYLVATASGNLSHERVLQGGNGIGITDNGANSTMEVTALLNSGGGLRFVTGKLAVKVADFIGFGLSDDGGNIVVNPAALAGTGLTVNSGTNKLDVNFGTGASQAAAGSNTITVSAGDGLSSGGSAQVGAASSTITLEVASTDIRGSGLSVSNNNLDLYLQGANGITITTGSIDSHGTPIIIDGTALGSNADITAVNAGAGLVGGGTTGALTLDVDYTGGASNIIKDATDGTAITVDEDNDQLMLFDATDDVVKYVNVKQVLDAHGHGTLGGGGVSASGVQRFVHRVMSDTPALSHIGFTGLDTTDVPASASLSVHLNGELLIEGDQATVEAFAAAPPRTPIMSANAHYYISGVDTIVFGFAVNTSDYLIAEKISLSNSSNTVFSVTAGTGLSGNATRGDVVLNVSGITVNEVAADSLTTSGESFADNDTTIMTSAAINDLIESKGYVTSTVGDITAVTAGTGLTGGGTSGDVTLNVSGLTTSEIHTDTLKISTDVESNTDTTIMTSKAVETFVLGQGYTTNQGDITSVVAGTGLSGGGTTGDVTLNVGGLTVAEFNGNAITAAGESFVDNDATLMTSAAINDLIESKGYTTEVGDITGVTAGTGLSGGGDTGTVTLNVSDLTVNEIHADSITVSGETFADNDTTLMTSAAINDLIESKGYGGGTGDITEVVAGAGLTTGGTSGSVTVDVDYAGNDSVIKTATDGTGITIDTENDLIILHDATDDVVKYVKPSQLTAGSAGVIGNAEDGDYTDGLFTDFSPTTPTGTAIDKFNEILKLLAPGPAPDVKSINTTSSNGISARLSFGATNTGGSTYVDSANSAGMTPIDTNGVYSVTTQGTSRRLGVFLTATNIEGIINHDVAIDQYANSVINHVADAFGNGETGTLKLFVNDMSTPVHSVDLSSFTGAGNPGSGSGTSFTSNSGFYNMSIRKDATSEGGTAFDIFQHRTGRYRIHSGHQRQGYNYAKVVHTIGSSDKTTNFIEWINDYDTTAITATGTSISNVVGSNEFVLSGIKYFRTASFDYATTVNNAFRGIHTATPIVFNSQYGSITAATDQDSVNLLTTFPNVGSGQDFSKVVTITSSGTFNTSSGGFPASGLLNGSNTVSINVVHPNTSKNQSGLASATVNNLLMWYPSASPTALYEDFNSETWRQQAGAYDTQAAVYTSGAFATPWSSSVKVNSTDAGHNTGLVQYQGQLRAPRNTLLNGNFASITNGPGSNADYSGITSGVREYIRAFRKTDAGVVRDVRLTLAGSASIIANGTAFSANSNDIKVFVKVPGKTGWMDLAGAFVLGSDGDNDGAHVSTYTSNISGSVNNYISFGLDTIGQNDHVLVKIQADATWNGNLSSMTMKFGASSGDESSVPDNCTSINSTNTNGIEAKLSFGAASSIPASDADHPYTNVTGTHSLANVNVNGVYSPNGNRKGIYDGTVLLTGVVNSGETGDTGNFTANAIRYGNEGTIKIFVNDAEKHSINLASFGGTGNPGSGTALNVNSNGSGFSNISTAQYVTWSDGIPDYRYNVRTMNWRVGAADQRAGHNWIRVVHTVGTNDYETNYVEWVNDPNGDSVTFSNVDLADFTDTDTSHLSGIEYFNSPSSTFKYRVNNMHRNIASTSGTALGFIGLTNVSITNLRIEGAGLNSVTNVNALRTSVPAINTAADTNYTLPMDVTGSFNYSSSKTLPGTYGTSAANVTISTKAYHPISNTSGASQSASKNNFLVWTPSQSSSSNQQSIEDFSGEAYRLQDSTYATTTDITNKTWDSTVSLVGTNNAYNTGLCIYNGNLIPPSQAGSSGDFSTGLQGPSGNVNYSLSNVTNNTRTYLRAFYNPNAGDSASNIVLRLTGTASLKSDGGPSNAGTLGNNTNVHIKVKLVYHSTESTKTTGWLDAGEQATGGNTDGAGCSGESLSGLNVVWNNNTQTVQINHPTGRGLYGTSSPFNRNYVIIKIETHKQWTGKFTDMRITSYN